MHEIAKHEFVTWVGLLDYTKLTEYEKTFLNIVIRNFDKIAKLSTAKGTRAKYLGERIAGLNNKTIDEIPSLVSNSVSSERIERIESLTDNIDCD